MQILEKYKTKFSELEKKLSDPSIFSNKEEFEKINEEYLEIKDIIEKQELVVRLEKEIEETNELLSSDDFKEDAEVELERLNSELARAKMELELLILPKDPNDKKNVILEIRAGSGGEEAALFASDLYRMYLRFCEKKGFSAEQLSITHAGKGGIKEVIANIKGKQVYAKFKYESGVHRVQRIPETEASGRIHTSAASVAILPEAEEVELAIEQKDLKIDVYRSSGPGGQSVNTTDSAVRITHLPSGMVVTCQDSKSQFKNRDQAMKVLRSRLLEMETAKQLESIDSKRKEAVSTGDRSAKIRTYNFPQDRVTDHRIKVSWFGIEKIMDGEIDEIVDTIATELREKSRFEIDENLVQE